MELFCFDVSALREKLHGCHLGSQSLRKREICKLFGIISEIDRETKHQLFSNDGKQSYLEMRDAYRARCKVCSFFSLPLFPFSHFAHRAGTQVIVTCFRDVCRQWVDMLLLLALLNLAGPSSLRPCDLPFWNVLLSLAPVALHLYLLVLVSFSFALERSPETASETSRAKHANSRPYRHVRHATNNKTYAQGLLRKFNLRNCNASACINCFDKATTHDSAIATCHPFTGSRAQRSPNYNF